MEDNILPRSFGTHDGSFHADEVTACALLLVFDLIDFDKIVRGRTKEKLQNCEYVCDVGGIYDPLKKRFDHHQVEYQGELSSAGMIWQYLKDTKRVTEHLYRYLNQGLIYGVDAHDNGRVNHEIGHATFSHVVSNFAPIHYDAPSSEKDACFREAVKFVQGHIERMIRRYNYSEECREEVQQAMQKKQHYLLFQRSIPWMDAFFEQGGEQHPALFVIMPSEQHWKLRGIPPTSRDRMRVRMPLPKPWAGLLDASLQKASGIPGAVFCHKGQFISMWKTKEDAIKALELTLRLAGIKL